MRRKIAGTPVDLRNVLAQINGTQNTFINVFAQINHTQSTFRSVLHLLRSQSTFRYVLRVWFTIYVRNFQLYSNIPVFLCFAFFAFGTLLALNWWGMPLKTREVVMLKCLSLWPNRQRYA